MSKPIIFCAQQRSGTTVLQTAFQATQKCKNYGEVFHSNYSGKNKFFSFKKRLIKRNINFCVPTNEVQQQLFDRYFNFLQRQSELPFHIIDIKYNSWHHFNPIWHNGVRIPHLLRLIQKKKIPIIHIIRKNALHQYISSEVAKKAKKWHYKKMDENLPKEKVQIDIQECKLSLRAVKKNIENFNNWLRNYSFSYTIYYEELFHDGKFTDKINNIAREVTDDTIIKLGNPPLKKGIKKPYELVKNRNQLIENLSKSPFAEFL